MRSIILTMIFLSVTFAVTPVKVLEMEETNTKKFISVDWAGAGYDYTPYLAYQIGDSSDALIKIEIYHLERGLIGTYNIPPSYEGEFLNDIYLGYTDGDDTPAFLYGNNFGSGTASSGGPIPENSSYLLDDKLNVFLTETGINCGISLFRVDNSTYAVVGTLSSPEKRVYYRLRNDLTSAAIPKSSRYSAINPSVRFSSNGNIAHFSNLSQQSKFEVFNMQGRRIYKTDLSANSATQSLPPMAAGTYIGRVKVDGGETGVTPFIKN